MKKFITKFVAVLLVVLSVITVLPLGAFAATPSVYYKTHVQNIGWTSNVYNGTVSGTTGRGFRVEALQIRISGMSGGITYRSHVQNYGWMGWCSNGQTSGTEGKSLRIEAIQIKLTGEIAKHYDVQYRAHVQNYGWMSWCSNSQTAGTEGKSLRIEAIQIKLVKKASSTASTTTSSTSSSSGSSATAIESGASYVINFKNSNMGANVQYAPSSGIGNVCLDNTSNREGNEVWIFTYNSTYKAWYITPKYRSDAALNALYGASCSKGSQAKLHPSNINGKASLWYLEKDGNYYRLKNVACGYYLDVSYGKTAAGTRLNLWSKDNSGNQLFTLVKVANASSSIRLNVPLFKQNDSRWANTYIGSKTIGAIGCTTTCISMVYSYKNNTTVYPNNMKSRLSYDNNDLYWSSLKNVGLSYKSYDCGINNTILSFIYTQLKAGKPVIIGATTSTGGSQHWVVITGYTGKSTSSFSTADFTINDPGTANNTTLAGFLANGSYADRTVIKKIIY